MSGNFSPISQSGTVTPGHAVVWTTSGVVQDAGTAANPGLTGIGILSKNQQSFSIANAPVSGQYSSLSMGVTSTAANITLASFNGAPNLPLNFVINGTTYPVPGTGGPYLPYWGGSASGSVLFGVEAFGVVNDPNGLFVAANTAAYNAAITAATGGRLVHPVGLSVVLNSITISVPIYLQLDGEIKLAANSNAPVIVLNSSHITIAGTGTIDGNKSNQSNLGGTVPLGGITANCSTLSGGILVPPGNPITLYSINISGITIQNVFNWPISLGYIVNSSVSNCIMSNSTNSPQFVFLTKTSSFNNNLVTGITDGGFVFYQGPQNCVAIGNNVNNCNDGIGVYTDNSTEYANSFINIIGNIVYSNAGTGIGVTTSGSGSIDNSNILIEGNLLYNNNTAGATTSNGSIGLVRAGGVTVQGNWISGDGANSSNPTYSIYVASSSADIVIDGNTVSNVGSTTQNGVAIQNGGGAGVAITNNKVFDTNASPVTAYAIGGTAGAKNVVSGNVQLTALATGLVQANYYAADTLIVGQINASGQTRFSAGVEIVSNSSGTTINASNPVILSGAGAPSATYPNGSLWLRTDGAANTRLYVSEGGGTWAAIASS